MTDGQNTNDAEAGASGSDKRIEAVCARMKSKEISDYTVACGGDVGGSEALLQRYALKVDFAFGAADDKQPAAKFKPMAGSLSNLRVDKQRIPT